MNELETEAIILRAIRYGERKNILTLFSKDSGLLSASAYISLKKRSYLSPLCRCTLLLSSKNSDLYNLKEAAPLDLYTELRNNLPKLNCAGFWLQTLLRSQLPSEPSPQLYKLLTTYLDHLKTISDPTALKYSFILKLLKHEGLYSPHEFPQAAHPLADARSFSQLENLLTPQIEKQIETHFWKALVE